MRWNNFLDAVKGRGREKFFFSFLVLFRTRINRDEKRKTEEGCAASLEFEHH